MSRKTTPFWARLLLSFVCTSVVVLVLLLALQGPVQRWYLLRGLDSNDPLRQDQTIRLVLGRVNDDATLREAVIERLDAVEDRVFEQLCLGLDIRGFWDPAIIPASARLRRVGFFQGSSAAGMRTAAAWQLASMSDQASDPALLELFDALRQDAQAYVRYNTLAAMAELYYAGGDQAPYRQWIVQASHDPHPAVARHAWIFRGLLNLPLRDGETLDWSPGDLSVFNPAHEANFSPLDGPGPMTTLQARDEAWTAKEARQAVQDAQAWALAAMQAGPDQVFAADQPDETLVVVDQWFDGQATPDLQQLQEMWRSDQAFLRELASVSAARFLDEPTQRRLLRELLTSRNRHERLGGAMLAGLTGLRVHGVAGFANSGDPQLLTLSVTELDAMSDEQIAQAGLERVELLDYWAQASSQWVETQTYQLAQWMRGDRPDLDRIVMMLLEQPSALPKSTLVLAMLERGDLRGLDYLLSPRGEPSQYLLNLFGPMRWWHVVEPLAPEGMPRFDVWQQPQVQALQLDIVRNWFLLHRAALTRATGRS